MRLVFLAAVASVASIAHAGGPITFDSLLKEMIDREALTRFPDPAYTCKQFSSYDRASTTPDDPKTWFANGDYNQFLRTDQATTSDGKPRKEWVMADMDGPGTVVRIWSANPKGNLRVYIDGGAAIEAPMAAVLNGKWKVAKPLSEDTSRGFNLYLPIPYAKHCKVTSDSDGFYYHVNYRTYAPGTAVESFTAESIAQSQGTIDQTQATLLDPGFLKDDSGRIAFEPIAAGSSGTIVEKSGGPGAIQNLIIRLDTQDLAPVLRSTILVGEFDGEQTIWCPLGDFFGQVAGPTKYQDFDRRADGGTMQTLWRMPYAKSVKLTLLNLGPAPVRFARTCLTMRGEPFWTDRSMHFHSTWHAEYPIHASAGKGTKDWNYLQSTGKGVYIGDSLAVMNPVPEWWGEGDEKIYVDGEAFPSHFGTGTEDYYGYAWGSNVPFEHPFHAQPRCDGQKPGNCWGQTTVSRVRSLDAIPFTTSFKFDMEVWHWRECDMAYAVTTYFYAMPGATTNRTPQPEEAAKPLPQAPPLPPPFSIAGAIECEDMKILAQSPDTQVGPQDMREFGKRKWSAEGQLWVQGKEDGAFVELEIPAGAGPEGKKPVKVVVYATKSWDYGIVRFSVNGMPGKDEDLFSGSHGAAIPSGPIDLGTFEPRDGKLILRAEVVGANEKAESTKAFFGLDCVVLTPAGGPAK